MAEFIELPAGCISAINHIVLFFIRRLVPSTEEMGKLTFIQTTLKQVKRYVCVPLWPAVLT